ncbi:MAG: hypothetical protein WCH98_09575 [Verrucomicrobiota bacterium]
MGYLELANGLSARQVQYMKEEERKSILRSEWLRAERLLAIPRPIDASPTESDALFAKWCESPKTRPRVITDEQWPSDASETTYGPLILPGKVANLETIAASLNSELRLIHHGVDNTWYVHDYAVDAYRPTTVGKLEFFIKALLNRKANSLSRPGCDYILAMRPFASKIVDLAGELLAADTAFFSGELGARRYIDGKIVEPFATLSHKLFAEQAVEQKPGAVLAAPDAYQGYWGFCQTNNIPALRRGVFKEKFTNETMSRWGIGMRNDLLVPSDHGEKSRACQGWRGLCLRLDVGLN